MNLFWMVGLCVQWIAYLFLGGTCVVALQDLTLLRSGTVGRLLRSGTVGRLLRSGTVGPLLRSGTVGRLLRSGTVGALLRSGTVGALLKLEFHRKNRTHRAASGRKTWCWSNDVSPPDAARCVRFSRWNSSFRSGTVGPLLRSGTVGRLLRSGTVGPVSPDYLEVK